MAIEGASGKNHTISKSYDEFLGGLEQAGSGKQIAKLQSGKLAQSLKVLEKQINKDISKIFSNPDSVSGDELTRVQLRLQVYMQKMSAITNIAKTMHEMVMNIVRNLR